MTFHHLALLLAPWKTAFSDSRAISSTVTTAHLLALLFSGGLAVAADRSTLRLSRAAPEVQARHLSELHAVHVPVLVAMSVLFASGLLLAASDIETYVASWLFWVKLSLVALLVANGAMLTWHGRRLRAASTGGADHGDLTARLWRRLRRSAIWSLTLWTATLVAGALLVNVS